MQKPARDLSSLDKIFGAFVTQSVNDYVDGGGVNINAIAVLGNKKMKAPLMILPIYEPFETEGHDMKANKKQVGSISKICLNTGKDAVMFMAALNGVSKSPEYGLRDTLMVFARRSDGASITKVYLKDIPDKDGVLTENSSNAGTSWGILTKTISVEDTVSKYIMDTLWNEFQIGLATERAITGSAQIKNAV